MCSDYSAEYRLAKENTKRLYAGKEVWAFLDENEEEPQRSHRYSVSRLLREFEESIYSQMKSA